VFYCVYCGFYFQLSLIFYHPKISRKDAKPQGLTSQQSAISYQLSAISTSTHQHISTSAHQHISTSAHQHINTSTHQHINTSANSHLSPLISTFGILHSSFYLSLETLLNYYWHLF